MAPDLQVLLGGMLTFGVPLAFAIHELIDMRRPPRGGGGPPPPPPGPKPLPDCLIPKRGILIQARELEDA